MVVGLPSFLVWLAVLSLLGLAEMGVDKLLASSGGHRLRERTLWLIALAGGFPGIFVGGIVFDHKTSKTGFWVSIIASGGVWLVALTLLT